MFQTALVSLASSTPIRIGGEQPDPAAIDHVLALVDAVAATDHAEVLDLKIQIGAPDVLHEVLVPLSGHDIAVLTSLSRPLLHTELRALLGMVVDGCLPATFVPQAWIRDYAVEIDDGRRTFNASRPVSAWSVDDVNLALADKKMELDDLAADLEERERHTGPFEVLLASSMLALWIGLYSGSRDLLIDVLEWDGGTWHATAGEWRKAVDVYRRVYPANLRKFVPTGHAESR